MTTPECGCEMYVCILYFYENIRVHEIDECSRGDTGTARRSLIGGECVCVCVRVCARSPAKWMSRSQTCRHFLIDTLVNITCTIISNTHSHAAVEFRRDGLSVGERQFFSARATEPGKYYCFDMWLQRWGRDWGELLPPQTNQIVRH